MTERRFDLPDNDQIIEAYSKIADQFAAEAPASAYNAYYERPATLSLVGSVKNLRVLDVGCGPGIYSEWLLSRGAEVTAIDASPEMLRLADRRLGKRAALHLADLRKPLSFAQNESVDLIIAPLVFDSILDWRKLLSEMSRLLVRQGTLVFSVGHPMAEFDLSPTKRYFDTEYIEGEWTGYGVIVPSYRRPLQEIIDPLIETGFRIERLLEAQPTEECRRLAPEVYEKLSGRPWFLCIRARKS
jgi:SAM-dependent methyltransferase